MMGFQVRNLQTSKGGTHNREGPEPPMKVKTRLQAATMASNTIDPCLKHIETFVYKWLFQLDDP